MSKELMIGLAFIIMIAVVITACMIAKDCETMFTIIASIAMVVFIVCIAVYCHKTRPTIEREYRSTEMTVAEALDTYGDLNEKGKFLQKSIGSRYDSYYYDYNIQRHGYVCRPDRNDSVVIYEMKFSDDNVWFVYDFELKGDNK